MIFQMTRLMLAWHVSFHVGQIYHAKSPLIWLWNHKKERRKKERKILVSTLHGTQKTWCSTSNWRQHIFVFTTLICHRTFVIPGYGLQPFFQWAGIEITVFWIIYQLLGTFLTVKFFWNVLGTFSVLIHQNFLIWSTPIRFLPKIP